MLPFERLRSLVRWSGRDHLELAVEAADCLAEFGDDPAGLVVGCRRLLAHHPDAAPLWWLCARVLAAPDPRRAAIESARILADDPTPRHLADLLPFPHDDPVAVVGWPPTVAAAAVARPDLNLIAVAGLGGSDGLHRRLRSVEQAIEALPVAAAVARRPTHVLVEPGVVGRAGGDPAGGRPVLLDAADADAVGALTGTGAALWVVVGAGRVLPDRLFAMVAGANRDRFVPFPSEAAAVIGPAGPARWGDRSLEPTCPVAPELLRPL